MRVLKFCCVCWNALICKSMCVAMVQKHSKNSHLINHCPTSEGVSEQADKWAMPVNEQTDEQVALYLRQGSWLIWHTVRVWLPLSLPGLMGSMTMETMHGPFPRPLANSLILLTHALAPYCLLPTACCSSALCCTHFLACSLTYLLPSAWKRGFCPWYERVDFIEFQPVVHACVRERE